MDATTVVCATQRYLETYVYPGERVIVGFSVDGGENGAIFSISAPAGEPSCTALGMNIEQALFNIIALRRKAAEKKQESNAEKAQRPEQPLSPVRTQIDAR